MTQPNFSGKQFTCSSCGTEFSVPQAALDKYPGWTPRKCLRCRSGPSAAAQPGSSVSTARPPSLEISTRATADDAAGRLADPVTNQILASVIEQFNGGPQDGIFTDGACSGNPGPGGWATIYISKNKLLDQRYGFEAQTTNNRMELTALIAGYQMIGPTDSVTIWSDSQLSVNIVNSWATQWEKNGWRRKGGPIKNLELVQEVYRLARSRPQAKLCWIKAHNGFRWNEYVDALATLHLR